MHFGNDSQTLHKFVLNATFLHLDMPCKIHPLCKIQHMLCIPLSQFFTLKGKFLRKFLLFDGLHLDKESVGWGLSFVKDMSSVDEGYNQT